MSKIRPIEQIYKQFFRSNPQAAKKYFELRKTNPKEADKFINSIFTGTINTAKNFIDSGKNWLGSALLTTATAGAIMNATANPSGAAVLEVGKAAAKDTARGTDKIAEFVVPFYSGTKEQIQAVNDYLDGKIDKDTYYKKVGSGTLSQALDGLLIYLGGKAASSIAKKYVKNIVNKGIKTVESQGVKAATKAVEKEVAAARNQIVKSNPTAVKAINEGKQAFSKEINQAMNSVLSPTYEVDKTRPGDVFNYFFETYLGKSSTKSTERATEKLISGQKLTQGEEEAFIKLVKENAAGFGKLADELGVKSKKEIPNMINFVKQLASIIENSPNYIKGMARGDLAGVMINSGLSLYDIYQAYKEGGDTLIPRTIGDLSRLGASAIPGGFFMKLLYGALGYQAGDKLTMAALNKLGVKSGYTPEQEQEIIDGYRQPGLDTHFNQYEQGASGRKYHVKGDRVYAFDTGKPVSLREFGEDVVNYAKFNKQHAEDVYKATVQDYQNLVDAKAQGYNITDEQLTNSLQNIEIAQGEVNSAVNELQRVEVANENEYDISNDLVQQYTDRYVTPQRALEEQRRIEAQVDYDEKYKQLFNRIAQANYQNVDQYFNNPQNLNEDYYQYVYNMHKMGAFPQSIEQFAEARKARAMYELAPQIHQQATQILQQAINQQHYLSDIGQKYYKTASDVEHNIVTEGQTDTKNKETYRHNMMTEQLGAGNLNVNQQNAQTKAKALQIQNQIADLKRQQLELEEQLAPYKKLNALSGAAQSTGPMGGMTMDQLMNIDPELGKQIFPAAFQAPVNQPQQPVQQSQPNLIDQGVQGVKQLWNNLTGQ